METLEGSEINSFHEKPNKKLAEKFLSDNKYSWNSGMFVFKAKVIIKELEKYQPKIIKCCKEGIKGLKNDLDFQRIDEKFLKKCPSISIDKAVMEKTNIGSVVPLDSKWSDVGSWLSLWEHEDKNENNNLIQGKVYLKKCS